jgi:hypothetical protein
VFLQAHGWVAMDPADVAKVMRQETPTWIKTVQDPVVAPVYKALYGGWEGNWVAYNMAHDVALPKSRRASWASSCTRLPKTSRGAFDSYAPDRSRRKKFKYEGIFISGLLLPRLRKQAQTALEAPGRRRVPRA